MKSFFLILTALVCLVTLSFAESCEETVGQPVTEQILEETQNLSEELVNMPDFELEEEPQEEPDNVLGEEKTEEPDNAPGEERTEEPGNVPEEGSQEESDNSPGEESTSEPTETLTETPTSEPTDTPTETPTSEPTDTPTETPTSEPTDTPTETSTSEPTDTPTETPTSEPTDTPTETPTSEPTDTPTETPTSEPSPTPPVTCFVLEPADGQLMELINGVWHFQTENDSDAMTFQWTSDYIPSGTVYSICVDDSFLTEPVLEEPITLVTSESSYTLQVCECARGRITVTMMVEEESLTSASLDFVSDRVIPQTEPPVASPPPATEEPAVTEMPSPEPSAEPKNNYSGMPKWRGMTRKGNSGGKTENESGITPGKALTSGHAKGNGDMTIYGAAESDLSAESCTAFITGEDIPPIVLNNSEGSFACREEAAALYLIPLDEESGWTVPVRALYALNLAGYQELKLYLGETETSLSTSFEPVGRIWARLRTRGTVVENCVLTVTEDKLFLHVNDVNYRVNEDGTLSETEAGML